jgi:hypothetical protein
MAERYERPATAGARDYTADFQYYDEIIAGGTIASAVVTCTPTGLTIGTPAIASPVVSVALSGGTAGTLYTVHVLATLATGKVLPMWTCPLRVVA